MQISLNQEFLAKISYFRITSQLKLPKAPLNTTDKYFNSNYEIFQEGECIYLLEILGLFDE